MKLKVKDGQQKMTSTMTKLSHGGHGGISAKGSKIKRTRSYDPHKYKGNIKSHGGHGGLKIKHPIKTPLRLNSPKFKKSLYKKYSERDLTSRKNRDNGKDQL